MVPSSIASPWSAYSRARRLWDRGEPAPANRDLAHGCPLIQAGKFSAVVVEGDYPDLFRTQPGRGSWLADMLGRLAIRYPEVPVVFSGSRRFAEEWAYRFLGAAAGDTRQTARPSGVAAPRLSDPSLK